jgi:DNA polymerase III subunit gamma/tau
LKILEEPPKHVKFILATTETHKVPETIISRCQRYDFKRISDIDIKNRLKYIAESEEIKIDDKSIEYIIKNSS